MLVTKQDYEKAYEVERRHLAERPGAVPVKGGRATSARVERNPRAIAKAAQKYQDEQATLGNDIRISDAVHAVVTGRATGGTAR